MLDIIRKIFVYSNWFFQNFEFGEAGVFIPLKGLVLPDLFGFFLKKNIK
jgi:hypothetical protein